MILTVRIFVLAFIALTLLSACGGGGKKKPAPTVPPPADTTVNWDQASARVWCIKRKGDRSC